jgi:hypothetical protein
MALDLFGPRIYAKFVGMLHLAANRQPSVA